MILSIMAGFVPTLLKLILTNPKQAAEEATVLHDVAVDITQADQATSLGTLTFTPAPNAAVKSKS